MLSARVTSSAAASTTTSSRRAAFASGGGARGVAALARAPAPPRARASDRGRSLVVRADVRKRWRSSKSMTLTIKDEDDAHDFASYISDGERIICVTFPDEDRREKLDDTAWRVRLRPFEFCNFKATVFCTLRLTPKKDGLHLTAEDLTIEGLPDEFGVNGKVWLVMDGALKPARTANSAGRKVLGKITVNLTADVNDVVAIVPGLDDAVNLINDTVISNLQGSLNATIAGDYARWKVNQRAEALA